VIELITKFEELSDLLQFVSFQFWMMTKVAFLVVLADLYLDGLFRPFLSLSTLFGLLHCKQDSQ